MNDAKRRRLRRRAKASRRIKRTVSEILLAPAKMPRITGDRAEALMKYCEMAALIFVAVLMFHMAAPELVGVLLVAGTGIVFGALLALICLGGYQDKLVEYELYGFKI